MRQIRKPVEDPHTVVIDGKPHWFADLETAKQFRLVELDRQIRHLTGQRERVAAELQQLRGARVYRQITDHNSQLDGVA